MNMDQRGWKPIAIKLDINERLNKMKVIPEESYNSIINRLLDYWDETKNVGEK
jgi:predicted CopG family antitoxin